MLMCPQRNDLERIPERDRVKYRFQVMIAIRSFPKDTEPEVDLTIGKNDHGLRDLE